MPSTTNFTSTNVNRFYFQPGNMKSDRKPLLIRVNHYDDTPRKEEAMATEYYLVSGLSVHVSESGFETQITASDQSLSFHLSLTLQQSS